MKHVVDNNVFILAYQLQRGLGVLQYKYAVNTLWTFRLSSITQFG